MFCRKVKLALEGGKQFLPDALCFPDDTITPPLLNRGFAFWTQVKNIGHGDGPSHQEPTLVLSILANTVFLAGKVSGLFAGQLV